jgi:hypothetical protein
MTDGTAHISGEGAAGDAPSPSPGEQFARAFREDPVKAEVAFDWTITDSFKPGKERHRLTARNLFRKQRVTTEPVRTWFETRPPGEQAPQEARLREDAFRFYLADYGITPVTAWVQVPDGLADDPASLAAFVDRRLMVRLGTAENRALTHDVIRHPDVLALPYRTSYADGLLAAFDEIEQTGGTGHALMVNPRDYYGELVGSGSLLGDLAREGVMVCRHRQVAPGCALVGDFAMAAVLLETGRSVIRVAEPPPGTFDRPGTAVCAEVFESVAVQLPTHFFHVVPG